MTPTLSFPKLAALSVLALLSLTTAPRVEAQFSKRIKDAVKQTAEDKAIKKTTDAEGKAIDTLTGGGQAARADTSKAAPAKGAVAAPAASAPDTASKAAARISPAAEAASGGANPPSSAAKPGEGAWVNYDFTPGDRVLFAEDFTQDQVGDFPKRLELKEGNMEVAEWQGGRYLRSTSYGSVYLPLPEVLPERFTLEFDYSGAGGSALEVYFSPRTQGPTYVVILPDYASGVQGSGVSSKSAPTKHFGQNLFPVRVMVDGAYAKVYMGDKRVANAPNTKLGRSNKIEIKLPGTEGTPALISNIRVAAGGKKLYDALAEKGRVATQGIYFDTGSDRIRPESSPTLKEIGTMLKEHGDLKLVIEGHTDNVGTSAANQTLSEKRAAAVRQFLIDSYGVDAARLQAKGYGETKPAGSNDTPEGRQNNRRVELVKM